MIVSFYFCNKISVTKRRPISGLPYAYCMARSFCLSQLVNEFSDVKSSLRFTFNSKLARIEFVLLVFKSRKGIGTIVIFYFYRRSVRSDLSVWIIGSGFGDITDTCTGCGGQLSF